jgi:squalene monooxygenase
MLTIPPAVVAFYHELCALIPILIAVLSVIIAAWRYKRSQRITAAKRNSAEMPKDYDVIIVGASIAGPPLAIQLARQGRRVLVVESDLQRPDRIVGELLQPGGIAALRMMGLEDCALSVGVPCSGYVTRFENEWVQLPYEKGLRGVSFHFGDFVMQLRGRMQAFANTEECRRVGGQIDVVESTVLELIKDKTDTIVLGIRYKDKATGVMMSPTSHLVALCDGGYTKFRPTKKRLNPHSYFVGVILRGVTMPFETKGHVILARDGPVLSYRLDSNEVRILADYHCTDISGPKPGELAQWLRTEILPQLPEDYQPALHVELERAKSERGIIRSHPHFMFTPIFPKHRGVVHIGDSGNQRHPLTGGGMTCAMRDAYFLAEALKPVPFLGDSDHVHKQLLLFLRRRPFYTSVVNMLSWALHGVFRGPMAMRKACFAYFECGGECVSVPMQFLSAINGSLALLTYHYCRVTIYGAIIVFSDAKFTAIEFAKGLLNPFRWFCALHLIVSATRIMAPLFFTEFFALGRVIDPTVLAPAF